MQCVVVIRVRKAESPLPVVLRALLPKPRREVRKEGQVSARALSLYVALER
jgi:hypothetical protein